MTIFNRFVGSFATNKQILVSQQLPILSLFALVFCVVQFTCWFVIPKLVVPHRDILIPSHMCPRVGYFLRTH